MILKVLCRASFDAWENHLKRIYMELKANRKSQGFPMDVDILPPSDDRIFKVLLTHPDAKKVLIDVISTVIERQVLDVHIRSNVLPAMDVDEKEERFDVNCSINTGDQINVEMQCSRMEEIGKGFTNFINRYAFYLAKLHSSQKAKGMNYYELARTYQITFCMYDVLPDWSDFVNRFTLKSVNGTELTDQINMVIVELNKLEVLLKKPVSNLTDFEKWTLFFRFAQDPVHRGKINDIIKEKEEINMAATLLREISQDEHERARYLSRMKFETDQYSNLHTAEKRGELRSDEKWQSVVADMKADMSVIIANKEAEIERLRKQIAELESKV